MKVLITDDEALARQRLRIQLESFENYEVVAEAANGLEALEMVEKYRPEIVLLDIRMPAMDGLEAAHHLGQFENPPAIIFTTAYDQHVLQAFDANATDYLLKPVRKERLQQALTKANRLNQAQLSQLAAIEDKPVRTHLCARKRGNLELIPIRDVIYLHADRKYVEVRHLKGETLVEESLKTLEQEFASSFLRVHRSTLVAKEYITGLEKDESGANLVTLRHTERRFEVSRRHLPEIRQFLKS